MKIESIRIQNFKVFHEAEVNQLPGLAVFLGKNGSGKTTFFDVFGFLHDCLTMNVKSALSKRGGYREVVSRNHEGEDISFTIQFRASADEPLITYELSIVTDERNRAVVKKEVLHQWHEKYGISWKVLDFSYGVGLTAEGELRRCENVSLGEVQYLSEYRQKTLESQDILAIKGLGQFQDYPAVSALRKLIEDWYVSDFRVDMARERHEAGYGEQLTRSGDNLSVVAKYIYDHDPEQFQDILEKMKRRVPGVEDVEAVETQDGYIVLRFQDGQFTNPFSSKFVSDGTVKLFTYLVLLHEPARHALLCVEEPENQLYPELLEELAEEFQSYADEGGQVFISTHSPDFLNAVPLECIYCLEKKDGFTVIHRAAENTLTKFLYDAGDLPGALWKQGLLTGGVE